MNQIPLRPDYSAADASRTRSVLRALAAIAQAELRTTKLNPVDAAKVIQRNWPNDHFAALVERAVSAPMTTASAADLVPTLNALTILSAVAPSGAAKLFTECLRVERGPAMTLNIPAVSSAPVPVFCGEGKPFVVGQPALKPVIVGPVAKMALGYSIANELEAATPDGATSIISEFLAKYAGPGLDAVVFGSAAAVAGVSPAGLLVGKSTLGATTVTTDNLAALRGDIGKLADAIAVGGGDPDRMIIFGGASAIAGIETLKPQLKYQRVTVPSLATDTIVGVDPKGIVSAFDGLPVIRASKEGTIHLEDTTPLDITTAAVGTNVKSMFQTDSTAVSLRVDCAWAKVVDSAINFISAVKW